MEKNFHVRFREHFFRWEELLPFCVHSPAANSQLLGTIQSLEPPRKPPSPSDSISLLTLYMWAPDIYEGSPTPVTAFLSIAPKISILANMLRVFLVASYGGTLQQIFFFCSIASMILGALAAMAQTKVKRLLAYSSIGHVGYLCIGFSCGTIEGIQSLLIGIFLYASMTIDAFAIVLALRQTRVKYIADLGALAKTNPILAITFSMTMFSYAGIPPLAGFCSKFYLFFAALGCGAYFLALVGVVTSVIGCWAAGRLPWVRLGDRSFPCTGHVAYRISCDTDGNACYERQGRVWYINLRLHILVRVHNHYTRWTWVWWMNGSWR